MPKSFADAFFLRMKAPLKFYCSKTSPSVNSQDIIRTGSRQAYQLSVSLHTAYSFQTDVSIPRGNEAKTKCDRNSQTIRGKGSDNR